MNLLIILSSTFGIGGLGAFKTEVVPDDFIVHFYSKYFAFARESFIRTKLTSSNVCIFF